MILLSRQGGLVFNFIFATFLDDDVAKYKLVTVVSYDADRQLHQLQLSPESQESPSSPAPSLLVDLGKSDVRLASPRLTVCQTRSSPVPSGQKRRKASCDEIVPLKVEQGSPMRNAAQLVSTDSKRAQIIPIPFSAETTGAQVLDTKLSADFLGFPVTREQRSSPNDATQLASNDSKRAHFIHIPFSAETQCTLSLTPSCQLTS